LWLKSRGKLPTYCPVNPSMLRMLPPRLKVLGPLAQRI
jgi:hypothetical protein